MNRRNLGGLIVLNVVLAAVLGLLSFSPTPAEAQFGGQRGGDYIMVAGKTPGRTTNTIYITDLNNGAIIGVTYDQGRRQLVPIAGKDIAADFQALRRR